MNITILGSNGWYSTETGLTTSILIEMQKYYVVLDAGEGFYKISQLIKDTKPIFVFLSHLHLDHIYGFHTLALLNLKQELTIFGYTGTKEYLNALIQHPFSMSVSELPYKVNIVDLEERSHSYPFEFECKLLNHPDPCLGYRLKLEDKIVSFCTDTGVCENLYTLTQGSDMCFMECSLDTGQIEEAWGHLNPEQAAEIAKNSNIRKLVLIHFTASIYTEKAKREKAKEVAKKIFENTVIAYDDLEMLM